MKKKNDDNNEMTNQELKSKESSEISEEEKEINNNLADVETEKAFEIELKKAEGKNIELENQVIELKDTLLRKIAEFENYKRRTENDQLNLIKYAAEPFIVSMLTVYDDLERSLDHIDENNSFDSLKKGLQLVYDKFTKVLENQGIKKIDAVGQPFNVDLHEALMQRTAEGVEPHTVLEILEHGYTYKEKVIRHSKVIVSADSVHNEDKESDSEKNIEG